MSLRRMLEWVAVVFTALLLIMLKWLHLGVLHYNWFLIILLAWCLALVVFFRGLEKPRETGKYEEMPYGDLLEE